MSERRKSNRVRARLPLNKRDGESGFANCINLSAGGLLFAHTGRTEVGDLLELSLDFPGIREAFELDCEVLRVRPTGKQNQEYEIAVRFLSVRHPSGRTPGDVLQYIALRGRNPYPVLDTPVDWGPHLYSNDMRPHWQGVEVENQKLDLNGCNYFPLPAPLPDVSYSARFDPRSVYFLSWVGVYIVPPVNGVRVPPEVYAELGNRDNVAWLRNMGDREPVSTMADVALQCNERDANGDESRWSVIQNCATHSDVGDRNPAKGVPAIMRVEGGPGKGQYESYQKTDQSPTYFEIWYENDYLIIAFVSCTEIEDRHGRILRNDDDPIFHKATQAMLRSICIIDDGSGFRGPGLRRR